MDTVRLGVIGLGTMGRNMLEAAAGTGGVQVPIAADTEAVAVEAVRADHPALRLSTDARAVLRADIDGVYLACPPAFHAGLAIEALRRGIAVFSEKPLAIDPREGEAMVAAAERAGAPTAVNFNFGDSPAVAELEHAIEDGEPRKVVGVDIQVAIPHWHDLFVDSSAWKRTRTQGGFVREVITHFLYLTDRLLGPPRTEFVRLDYPAGDPTASETSVIALLRAGDVPIRLVGHIAEGTPATYDWWLHGSRRSFLLRDWNQLHRADRGRWIPIPAPGHSNLTTRLGRFVDTLRGVDAPSLPDFATGLRVQRVVETIAQSAP